MTRPPRLGSGVFALSGTEATLTDATAVVDQASTTGTPPAGTTDHTTDPTPTTDQASDPQDVKSLPKWAQDLIRATRKEAADHRTKAQQLEDAKKSDLDRATAERDLYKADLESTATRLRDATARSAVMDAAGKAGAIAPRAVYAMVRESLQYGDDGEPTNVAAAIAAAKRDEPQLFRAAPGRADGGANGSAATDDMNVLMRDRRRGR